VTCIPMQVSGRVYSSWWSIQYIFLQDVKLALLYCLWNGSLSRALSLHFFKDLFGILTYTVLELITELNMLGVLSCLRKSPTIAHKGHTGLYWPQILE
jgi:hypothetical protein